MKHYVFCAVGMLASTGCGDRPPIDSEAAATEPAATQQPAAPPALAIADQHTEPKPPFEFREIDRSDKRHDFGPQLVITLETTNDVAKKATKEDLQKLWDYFAPEFGDRRAFLYVQTDVPGAGPWAIIRRLTDPFTGKTDFNIEQIEWAIDAEPYFFPNKIDRSVENQQGMMLTLPVVNRIVELAKQDGWEVTRRTEDFVHLKVDAFPQSATMTMTPEHLSLDGHRLDDVVFVNTVVPILNELGIGEQVKTKLQSVIGSPQYVQARAGKIAEWTWPIRDLDIEYTHYDTIDKIYVTYRQKE